MHIIRSKEPVTHIAVMGTPSSGKSTIARGIADTGRYIAFSKDGLARSAGLGREWFRIPGANDFVEGVMTQRKDLALVNAYPVVTDTGSYTEEGEKISNGCS